jgi:hypothetical protein
MARPAVVSLPALLLLPATACAPPPLPRPLVTLQTSAVGAVETYGPGLVATDDSGETATFVLEASAGVVVVRVWPGSRLEPVYPLREKDTTYFQTGTHTVHIAPPSLWVMRQPGHPPIGSQGPKEEMADRCMWEELRRVQPSPTTGRAPDDAARRRPQSEPLSPVILAEIEDRCRHQAGLDVAQPGAVPARVPGGEYYLLLVASDAVFDAKHLVQRLAGIDITNSSIVSVLQVLPAFLASARAHVWAGYAARVGGR